MITGTSNFIDYNAAVLYYSDYGYHDVHAAVRRKINEGEIHFGPPTLKAGESVILIDQGRRYAIESE